MYRKGIKIVFANIIEIEQELLKELAQEALEEIASTEEANNLISRPKQKN